MAITESYRISWFFTSESRVKDMIIMKRSGIMTKSFTDIKEARKFINDLLKIAEKDNSLIHYNMEELQSVLLESRGKITRDNKLNDEAVT